MEERFAARDVKQSTEEGPHSHFLPLIQPDVLQWLPLAKPNGRKPTRKHQGRCSPKGEPSATQSCPEKGAQRDLEARKYNQHSWSGFLTKTKSRACGHVLNMVSEHNFIKRFTNDKVKLFIHLKNHLNKKYSHFMRFGLFWKI